MNAHLEAPFDNCVPTTHSPTDVDVLERLDSGHIKLGTRVLHHGQRFAYFIDNVWYTSKIIYNPDISWYHDERHELVVGLPALFIE